MELLICQRIMKIVLKSSTHFPDEPAKFTKKAERLMKKYVSLVGELRELEEELCVAPTKGTPILRSEWKSVEWAM